MRPTGKYSPIIRAVFFLAIILFAIPAGIRLRDWSYSATVGNHFTTDVDNAWYQGTGIYLDAVLLQRDGNPPRWRSFFKAYLDRYDKLIAESPNRQYGLDYPPGRLLIMALWVKTETPKFVPFLSDPSQDKFVRPLLWIDTIAELLAAALVFLVVRLVLSRQAHPQAAALALLAALLLWFNPAVLMDRLWPQWDSWALPFYLLAAFLALHRKWLAAGVCIGVGIMFKGQVLCAAPVFILWPLFQRRFRATLQVIIGQLLGASICVSPWLIRTPLAACLLIAILAISVFSARYVPRHWRFDLITASVPVGLFLSGFTFGGSFGWWFVAFVYGSERFKTLSMGPSNNLGALLMRRWNWRYADVVYENARFHLRITMKALMVAIYAVALTACAFGLARQDHRGDRRVLIALAAPWLLMFAFMPEMHERYLYWGAALTAMAAGVSLGTTLLHLAISFLACASMAAWLYREDSTPFAHFIRATFPDAAWAVILIALIILFLAIEPGPRTRMGVINVSHGEIVEALGS